MSFKPVRILGENKELGTRVELWQKSSDNSLLAVKRITNLDTSLGITLFQKEAEALKRLRGCENIVSIIKSHVQINPHTGIPEGILLMEYLDGKKLSELIFDIPNHQIRYSLVKQLCSAIQYAHKNLVIHRDINPDNIIVDSDYHLWLIDFGISKIRGKFQKGTTFQYATQNYSAPEVTQHSENATERSDIYSLGAVIYTLFTGRLPGDATDMEQEINTASGLDPELKTILVKMCSFSASDRYANLDECMDPLNQLIARYEHDFRRYYITVPFEILQRLRWKYFVSKHMDDIHILSYYFPSQFQNCIMKLVEENDGVKYHFYGRDIEIVCELHNDSFCINDVLKLDSFIREKQKSCTFEVIGQIVFLPTNSRSDKRNNYNNELAIQAENHHNDMLSDANVDKQYRENYGIWKQFIDIMINDASTNAIRIPYSKIERREGILYFTLTGEPAEFSFTTETGFIMEINLPGKKRLPTKKTKTIGTFIRHDVENNMLILKSSPRLGTLPPEGEICTDYTQDIAQYKRQASALEDFRCSITNNNGDLKGILAGVHTPTVLKAMPAIHFFNEQLDLTQQRAVRKILRAEQIAIIQGPPGTGKTNVLVEVIRQILAENQNNPATNQKVLIVSQAHTAVDKILQDLRPYISQQTQVVRIGDEQKIQSDVNEQYGLLHCRADWARMSANTCSNRISERLHKLGIQRDEFDQYTIALEMEHVDKLDDSERERYQDTIRHFTTEHAKLCESSEFRQCIVAANWACHIVEANELEEYYVRNATIIAGTCAGVISNSYVRDVVFDYVIIDEAAKATFPEILVPMIRARKVVLVGDHKQLPPVFDEAVLRKDGNIRTDDLVASGFAKLFELLPDISKETLSTQYRMHPVIGRMISTIFYDGIVQDGVSVDDRAISLPSYKNKVITWISTSKQGSVRYESARKASICNELEVTAIQQCLDRIQHDFVHKNKEISVGIITAYRAQLNLINNRIQLGNYANLRIDTNTVDAFQGSQRDIIIYSTVRSNINRGIGFLKVESRLNVSLSRARCALFLVGDHEFLNSNKDSNNRFREIIQYIKQNADCQIIEMEEY